MKVTGIGFGLGLQTGQPVTGDDQLVSGEEEFCLCVGACHAHFCMLLCEVYSFPRPPIVCLPPCICHALHAFALPFPLPVGSASVMPAGQCSAHTHLCLAPPCLAHSAAFCRHMPVLPAHCPGPHFTTHTPPFPQKQQHLYLPVLYLYPLSTLPTNRRALTYHQSLSPLPTSLCSNIEQQAWRLAPWLEVGRWRQGK